MSTGLVSIFKSASVSVSMTTSRRTSFKTTSGWIGSLKDDFRRSSLPLTEEEEEEVEEEEVEDEVEDEDDAEEETDGEALLA